MRTIWKPTVILIGIVFLVVPALAQVHQFKPGFNLFSKDQDVQLGKEAAGEIEKQVELVSTLLFVIVILGSTQGGAPTQMAGLAIGITLVAIHIFGINITGVSVNPARSLGPALFVGGKAISQVWMFLIVPSIAGILGGTIFRTKVLAL